MKEQKIKKDIVIGIRVTPEIYWKIKGVAEKIHTTSSWWIRNAIFEQLKKGK